LINKQRVQAKYTLILVLLLLAASWKIGLALLGSFPFNSDEAIVGLMARHILLGERPIFFYGQAYMGSLDAFLVAAGFWLLGEHIWVIRLVQGLLYVGILSTTVWAARLSTGSLETGILAAGLLVIPTVNLTLYTTVSLGGYGEALLIGNLILISALRIANQLNLYSSAVLHSNSVYLPVVFGFLCGFGLWTLGVTGVYILPALLYLVIKIFLTLGRQERLGALAKILGFSAVGAVIGAFPWWIYALQHGVSRLLGELLGSAVAVEQTSWMSRSLQHLVNLLLLGVPALIGLRPPWEVRWLALPLAPFILAVWVGVGLFTLSRILKKDGRWVENLLLVGVVGVLLVAFIFTAFGVDPSGRYFLPINVIFAILAAQAIRAVLPRRLPWQIGGVALLVAFNLTGTLDCALRSSPGITTQFNPETVIDHHYDVQLIQFLEAHGEKVGYTDYWVSYPLAFESSERLVFVPKLPYHRDLRYTERDDRYPPYDRIVADGVGAYISTNHPALDEKLRQSLLKEGVNWQEKRIGDYLVFYHLSKPVTPEILALISAVQ
jgi:4-amino-4-deoxy-L-arabinose transferase-like glycosyltransferase